MKKILITTGIFPPDIGGPATYSSILLKELPGFDYNIGVLTYGVKEQASKGLIYVVSNKWPKGIRHLVYFLKVLWLGRGADLILCVDSSFGASFISLLAALILRKKFVVRITGDYAWEQGVQRYGVKELMDEFQRKRYGIFISILRRCQNFVVCRADLVITPSNYLKNTILNWGAKKENIKVIYNAVSATEIKMFKEEARQKLNLSGRIMISAGRLVLWKGFGLLIEIVSGLKKQIPDLKLIIAGDGPERENLDKKTKDLNLENNVLLVGALPKNELAVYMRSADIFVLNTGYEGLSHQLIEAMAMGLPVITTRVGGNTEVVDNQENGILVEYNNKKQLEEAIIRLFMSDELKNKLAEKARDKAALFSRQNMISATVDLLKKYENFIIIKRP
ncbi:MAG: hypothetical protein Athens071426_438 [Parcubacteria group bacterium Athens0714_26]|nr:MAG: hypothetical protein Athens101426_118 [Parcubacteria group bacterium Athens1014_26]TSD02622.1 MAG: hypothetical protein Athens071426_438 [Parcubacteria group bacterium Athens0714_26]